MRVIAVTALLLLAACSSVPNRSEADGLSDVPVTVGEIQQAVACEFAYALAATGGAKPSVLEKWGAIVALGLSATDTSNIVPGLGDFSTKVGNASVTTKSAALTYDNSVTDKNDISYYVGLKDAADYADCSTVQEGSSGLQLADFLIGTAQVLQSGGMLTSTALATKAGFAEDGTLIGAGTPILGVPLKDSLATVRFTRTFTVKRSIGGMLSFKVGDASLSLTSTGSGRERKTNTIIIIMGELPKPVGPGRSSRQAAEAFVEGVRENQEQELRAIKDLTPNQIIVVTPPATE